MTQDQQPSKSLAYKVLYNIDREAAYDLRNADSPYKVGEVLREQLMEWQQLDEKAFEERISDYYSNDGRFVYFAQLHGWMEQISQARSCFDLKSEENRERLGAYDLRTAAYRFCRMLGVTPYYILDNGSVLKDGTDFDKQIQRPLLLTAIRHGSLSQWMAAFYHEDPTKDFGEAFSYERKLEEWINRLGEVDQSQYYYKRFVNARKETAQKYKEVRQEYKRARSKEVQWRITYYVLAIVWMALLIIFGVSGRDYVLGHALVTIALPVGGVTSLIVALRAYFRGYGFVFSFLWGLLGFLSSWIPIFLLKFINGAYPDMFVPTAAILTIIYMAICHFTDYRGDAKSDSQLMDEVMEEDDVKSTLLEPLYYTFKQKSFRFKGSKFGLLDDVTNQVRSLSGESVIHYVLWSLMMALLVLEMVLFNAKLLNVNTPELKNMSLSPTSVVKQLQKDVE
jgi:hypothetical protein